MIDLYAPGAYARAAGGNLERPNDQRPVIDWMAWSLNKDNGGNGGKAVWDKCRQVWRTAGIAEFPWMHVRSMEDLERLISVGEGEDSPTIGLNIEDVVKDGLDLQKVGARVRDAWVTRYGKPVHMATLPWVQNGQGWQHLAFAVAALEIMPDEQLNVFPGGVYDPVKVQHCITHAFAEGLTKITLMFKTKAPHSRAMYGGEFAICHSLYTADDIDPSAQGWAAWDMPAACVKLLPPAPPQPPEAPMLTAKQFPFTGPLYGPSGPEPTRNRATVKGLKRAMIRLRYLDQPLGDETDDYGPEFEEAMRVYQAEVGVRPASGQYGRNTWLALRGEKVVAGPQAGKWAMDARALSYVREDNLKRVYPHPQGALSSVGQGLHPTAGITGNWGIDFMAPGGTKVLAVEDATIRKLSGRDPADGAQQAIGIFGWSIHYETPDGYRYFSTHYGTRSPLKVGQIVNAGQTLGTVGTWPGDPTRSHTHLGVTSPKGEADAKKRITEISQAPRVVA